MEFIETSKESFELVKQCGEMKLIAIYNVWADGLALLRHSVENILPVVDQVLIVFSNYSNYGHFCAFTCLESNEKITYLNHEPNLNQQPHENECKKRNAGLNWAKEHSYTHFINMDADEFYEQEAFKIEKQDILNRDVIGSVCKTKVYFKSPSLTIGYDHTLVPFIHKITPSIRFQLNSKTYPFAYDKNGNAHIDPTRRLNIESGVEWCGITMHHYSWVRSDYNLKIENSAARNNLRKSSVYKDLENAAEGEYNEFYRAKLMKADNLFNIPEL